MCSQVGEVLRQRPGSDQFTPMALIDQDDDAAHLFQRAPAVQLLHDRLVSAGVEVIYRNEPGAASFYKVRILSRSVQFISALQILLLDGTGYEFGEGNSMCFQVSSIPHN